MNDSFFSGFLAVSMLSPRYQKKAGPGQYSFSDTYGPCCVSSVLSILLFFKYCFFFSFFFLRSTVLRPIPLNKHLQQLPVSTHGPDRLENETYSDAVGRFSHGISSRDMISLESRTTFGQTWFELKKIQQQHQKKNQMNFIFKSPRSNERLCIFFCTDFRQDM